MGKFSVAICHGDQAYSQGLARYMSMAGQGEIAVAWFSEPEKLEAYSRENKLDAAIVAEKWAEEGKDNSAKKLWVLSEEQNKSKPNYLFRYQPAGEIYRQVCGSLNHRGHKSEVQTEGAELTVIYSPSKVGLRMPFALTYATERNKERKVLYVNVSENSGLGKILGCNFLQDLADLFFFKSEAESYKLQEVIRRVGGLDLLPPLSNGLDLRDISRDKWLDLFHYLATETDYEEIVVDMEEMIPGFDDLIEMSSRNYWVMGGGLYEQIRMEAFREIINQKGIEIRLKDISLSYGGENIQEAWAEGPLGEYVRRLENEQERERG